ncbi:phosphatase PAP2 family protein [Janibacter indicus]|uniref:PAP2 superfamily protein n=1 Tax=Janibacter indicus TaxID=857417 RepID=A0A1W1ZQ13_9MICO|nr:phosphatase PAP2 family protein [Janibacter indicus]SMC50494.1 PAP2 superfamily protein [Janibacter indicus]
MGSRQWRLALGCAVGFVVVYVGAVVAESGQQIDNQVFGAAQQFGGGSVAILLPWVARRLVPAALVVAVVVAALVRWRWDRRRVLEVAAFVVVSVVVSRLLRDPVLWRPVYSGEGYAYPFNTFPSTHVTLVAALLVAVRLLLPRRPRGLVVALGLVLVLAMVGNVVGLAHRPSDTLGSILVVGTVAGVVFGVSARADAVSS